MDFENLGLNVPAILLPKPGTDMTRWAVVACDQYTSQPEYWDDVKNFVAGFPSTFHIILPEVYLDSPNKDRMIENINSTMKDYLSQGFLVQQKPGFILVDRKTSHSASRKGLIVALDLEKYDYSKGSQTLIRATEGTVVERLPPRIKIRENAAIEVPHIMVLIDDPAKTVIEPLFAKNLKKLYDFDLMKNSGHLKGYAVDDEKTINEIAHNLSKLADPETFNQKYNVSDKGVLLFAVGDGNHSLATAKSIWESLKKKGASMHHPARYAMVELVNVHDEGLHFEPIHRVLFNINTENFFSDMRQFFEKQGSKLELSNTEPAKEPNKHTVRYVSSGKKGFISVINPKFNLEVGTLQSFLDDFMKRSKDAKIDYVHGDDVVADLGSKPNNLGLFLPAMSKNALFRTVIVDGVLPRKTFSMGEADEKRFYLECRKIV